jgi:hypothetical protein
MAVLNDYECLAHGHFEAFEAKCPHGCSKSFVKLVFLQPVGTRSRATKWTDNELKAMAKAHNLSDIRNDKDGTSTMTKLGRTGEGTSWVDLGKPKGPIDLRALGADAAAKPGFVPGMDLGPGPKFQFEGKPYRE